MANLDFYAIDEDITDILEFIFAETDCKLFESYSKFGLDLREFISIPQVIAAYNSSDPGSLLLQLWSPSVSSKLIKKKISLDPKKCNGATYRFSINGWGLMQLYFGRTNNGKLCSSHFGHNSEKRARKWEPVYLKELGSVNDWDWSLLTRISNRIQYHIGKRLAVSKFGSRPILKAAFNKHSEMIL